MENVINFDLLKEYDGTLKEVLQVWTKQKSYSLGDKVKYKGHLLECTTAGTSGTITLDFTDLDVGDTITDGTVVWELVEPSRGKGIDFYTVGESYEVGDIVIYSGNIYQCTTAHTATSTFDNTKWEEISKSGIPYYSQDTYYKVDDQVVYNNKIYKCITAHTSTSTFDSAKWAEISAGGGGISIWQANTAYEVNDVVIDSNLIWQCATAHTSASTFDESKWICISGGEISNGMEIVPLWEGAFNFSNSTQGATPTSSTPMIELSEPISNFEYILVCGALDSGLNNADSVIVPISAINPPSTIRFSIVIDNNDYYSASINQYDSTHLYIAWKVETYSQARITKVQGIRKAKPIVSSGMKYETLWEGEAGNLSGSGSTTVNLSESVRNYKKIGFTFKVGNGNGRYYYREYSVDDYLSFLNAGVTGSYISFSWGYGNSNDYVEIYVSSTDIQLIVSYMSTVITKITGISEGVVIPTGVQAARVTLWEGLYNTVNNSSILTQTQEILSIEGYDQFEVTYNGDDAGSDGNITSLTFNTSDIVYGIPNFRLSVVANSNYYSCPNFGFADSTHFGIRAIDHSGWPNTHGITKITGIKYIQPDSYSTEEKLIGTWIDGKPLYQKTFTGTSPSSANTDVAVITVDAGTDVHDIDGYLFNGNNTYIPLNFHYSSSGYVATFYYATNCTLLMRQSGYGNQPFYITLKYTKV